VNSGLSISPAPGRSAEAPAYAGILLLGGLLWWSSADHPAVMPF
jgi:hypothetical protein